MSEGSRFAPRSIAEWIARLRDDNHLTFDERDQLSDLLETFAPSETQRWIPVSERFPKGRDKVICLVYTPTDADGDESLPGVLVAMHTDDGWQSRTDTGCWEPGEVTHWMPLPDAPK